MSKSYPLREQGTFLVVERTGWDRRLSVVADGKRLIGHAGAVLLRRCADRTGLTDALTKVLPSSTVAGWRDRAAVLVQLAVAIVLGAENLSEAEQLHLHHRPLFGRAASDSTARRMLAALDEATLVKIAKVRARVRRQVWSLLHLRPGGFPWLTVAGKRLTGWIVIDLDATIITAASKKTGADWLPLDRSAASNSRSDRQAGHGRHSRRLSLR
ncbi:transposase [Streptomyces sp. NPDC001982]|uniref:transposase n=1 Tax=Streptomyces sp. NPDC001982 TaxID=3154405 RepID=UPI0033187666